MEELTLFNYQNECQPCEMEIKKVCNTCKRELPATTQYYYKFKHSKDGLRASCKECQGGKFIKKEELPDGYRRCSRCKKVLPETEEYFLKYWSKKENKYYLKGHCLECGKELAREWRQTGNPERYKEYAYAYHHSERGKNYSKKWKQENRDKVNALKRANRRKPENIKKRKAYERSIRENPVRREHKNFMTARWKANNKDKVAEYNKAYSSANKDYFRLATHKRNARQKRLPRSLTLAEWNETKAEFSYACAYCGKTSEKLTQDHVVPLVQGGGYTKQNIIPACKSCNSSKHATPFEEWYRKQSFFSEERYKRIVLHLTAF